MKSSKLFVILAVFLWLVGSYFAIPAIYTHIQEDAYTQSFRTFAKDFTKTNHVEELCLSYALENQANITIHYPSTNTTYTTPKLDVVHAYQKEASLLMASGEYGNITLVYTFNKLDDINTILQFTLPSVGLFFILVYLFGVNQNKKADRFNKAFYETTNDMLRLKPKARLIDNSLVATNINQLYDLLLEKNEQYDKLNEDYQIVLSQSKQTLNQTYDHLDKEVNDILEIVKGMLSNKGMYTNHTIGLMDIKVKLEELLQKKDQPLKLPQTIHEIFQLVLSPYEQFSKNQFVTIHYNFEKNFKITIDDLLFRQMMACLMTFILNQCNEFSQIKVMQNDYDIMISYQGACLSEESIAQIEALDENVKDAYRYAKQMGFFLSFHQTQEKDGMQFIFHF